MFIYGVLPGIIICFFYATIKALTQRTPEGIVDIIYILCTLIIFPVAYGYFIYRRINAKKDKKCEIRKIELEREQNKSYFIKDLCEFERSYDYKCIYVDFISTDFGVKNISKLHFIYLPSFLHQFIIYYFILSSAIRTYVVFFRKYLSAFTSPSYLSCRYSCHKCMCRNILCNNCPRCFCSILSNHISTYNCTICPLCSIMFH